MKGYKVGAIAAMGYELDGTYYTTNEQKARNEMARRLMAYRKRDDVGKRRKSEYGEPTFHFKRGNQAFAHSLMSVTVWIWSAPSYWEGESDLEPEELCLWEIDIED